LNQLYEIQENIKKFEQRQALMEVKAKEIRAYIDSNLA
jgi:hypothetical protein